MKRITIITIVLLILIVGTCGIAYAGVWDSVKDWVLDNAIGTALTAIFLVISGFFGGSKIGKILLKSKLPIEKLVSVGVRIHKARSPVSEGGTRITTTEKDEILAEVEELIASIVNVFGKGSN